MKDCCCYTHHTCCFSEQANSQPNVIFGNCLCSNLWSFLLERIFSYTFRAINAFFFVLWQVVKYFWVSSSRYAGNWHEGPHRKGNPIFSEFSEVFWLQIKNTFNVINKYWTFVWSHLRGKARQTSQTKNNRPFSKTCMHAAYRTSNLSPCLYLTKIMS